MEKRERNSYWVSMFGQNILYCIISTGLLYYFQNIIFIPVTFIGVVVLIAQIIDAVKDPIMGIVIDKTESRLGKCRFYLIIGLPIAMCATIIPFINGTYNSNNTGLENNLILIWVFVSYIIWLLAFTLIDVPLWSLASCITSDKKLRENLLMGARVAASLAAGLVPLIIVPISQLVADKITVLWQVDENLKIGTIIVVVLLTILGGGLMVPNNIFSKERVVNSKTSKLSIKEMLAAGANFRTDIFFEPYRNIIFFVCSVPAAIGIVLSIMPMLKYDS